MGQQNKAPRPIATRLTHGGLSPHANHGIVNPPVYRTSTILKPTLAEWEATEQAGYRGYSYGRTGTPTSHALEEAVTDLYGCDSAVVVNSGLSAIALALLALTGNGDHVLVSDSIYYPCRRLCDRLLSRFGVAVTYYDPTIGGGIAELIRPKTRLICAESPGSLTFEVQDIPAIAAAAKARGVTLMMDNTWATALHFNPFAHGVDIVVESATKYLAGHSDALAGFLLAGAELGQRLRTTAHQLAYHCAPDDVFLVLRGIRTLGVRMPQHQESGLKLAKWFQGRPEVARVLHPALPEHPGHDLWRRDFTGSNGLVSIVLHPVSKETLAAFVDGLRLFGIGASWGGYESLVMPAEPQRLRTATRWNAPGPFLRFHAGLEDPDDLIADLEMAFDRLS